MPQKKINPSNDESVKKDSLSSELDGRTIQGMLQSLPVNDILTLIDFLIKENEDTKRLILEWIQKHFDPLLPHKQVQVDIELLWEYWAKAEEIISEFNEYGGGPEEKEEEAYDWLEDISNLIKKGSLSSQIKMDFINEAFWEYDKENSGFEDAIMDLFFEICTTREEWLFLIENLQKKTSRWRDKLIMDILKNHLHDDDNYLKLRMKHLHFGLEYWDLVTFYLSKNDTHNAISFAEQGLTKGKGRIDELVDFLKKHYRQQGDTVNLKRIHQILKSRKAK